MGSFMATRARLVFPLLLGALLVLCETAAPQGPGDMARIQAKSDRVRELLSAWVAAGGSPEAIAPLGEQVELHMKARRLEEAEAGLDRILAIVTKEPSPVAKKRPRRVEDMARIQAKSDRVDKSIPDWLATGGRPEVIAPLGEQVDVHMKAGRLEEAEAELDRILAIVTKADGAAVESHPFTCPPGRLDLDSGAHVGRDDCTVKGSVVLSGTASLTVVDANLVIDGHVMLSGDAVLKIENGTLTIANRSVMQYTITATDRARLEVVGGELRTNAGVDTNLSASYRGSGDSLLRFVNSELSAYRNWLLADFSDRARLESVNSPALPCEIYPHDASTITISGADTRSRIWLEFRPGFRGRIENLPGEHAPFAYSFGRNTPALTNVEYQVDVTNARTTFGVNSHPRSHVTIRNNEGPITIGYWLDGGMETQPISGLRPGDDGPQTLTMKHQGRLLELVNVSLNTYAWQVYVTGAPAAGASIQIEDSSMNEIGDFDDTPVVVDHSEVQFAIVAATGRRGDLTIRNSTIHAQAIMAENESVVRIEDSRIFGSVLQARGHSTIVVLNTRLEKNKIHPSSTPNVPTSFEVAGSAKIVGLALAPLERPIRQGAAARLEGEAFVRTAKGLSKPSFRLFYRRAGDGKEVPVPTSSSRADAVHGALPTGDLGPGSYEAVAELTVDGATYLVTRPFSVEAAP